MLNFELTMPINAHRWASTSIIMSAISDLQHRHLLFRHRNKISRTENCPSDKKIFVNTCRIQTQDHSVTRWVHYPSATVLFITCLLSDIVYQIRFIPYIDIMSDSALFSPKLEVPISSSVLYRWSQILEQVPTYVYEHN